ncbi:ArnT family glycosyltransferase [Prevotella sp.]|uniref:ArnT family glycosyltransferase n=1 Tax=Prevotella sp. TaxID=59823 RepID=UPI003DA23310
MEDKLHNTYVKMIGKSKMGKLKLAAWVIGCIWLLAQIVLMFCQFGPQQGDWGTYIMLAHRCYDSGEWYPMKCDLYSEYIFAPGLVNLLIAEFRLLGTLFVNKVLYLFLNIGVLINIFLLAKHFFSERIAYIASILYCALYVNWFIALSANTELPFLFLALSAVSLCVLGGDKAWKFVLAGILLGLANWIRPLAVIFVVGIILYYFVTRKWTWKLSLAGVAMIATVLLIGFSAKRNLGRLCFQSTTSGFNLIMTANDKAFGGVDANIWEDPTSIAYIENEQQKTCFERDSIRMARAIAWIECNPIRYAELYIKKIPVLLAEDSWSDQRIFGSEQFMYKYQHGLYSKSDFAKRLMFKLLKSIPYYLMLLLFAYSLWKNRKDIFTIKGWILTFFVVGMLLTCLYPVQPRYHYPFMFPLIIWAASGADTLIYKKRY